MATDNRVPTSLVMTFYSFVLKQKNQKFKTANKNQPRFSYLLTAAGWFPAELPGLTKKQFQSKSIFLWGQKPYIETIPWIGEKTGWIQEIERPAPNEQNCHSDRSGGISGSQYNYGTDLSIALRFTRDDLLFSFFACPKKRTKPACRQAGEKAPLTRYF